MLGGDVDVIPSKRHSESTHQSTPVRSGASWMGLERINSNVDDLTLSPETTERICSQLRPLHLLISHPQQHRETG